MKHSPRLNLSDSSWLRLITLCALYVAQGIPFGFVSITLKNYLVEEGLGVKAISGFLTLTLLPWSFKWAWGPVIDRFGILAMGRRRPWILLAQSLMAVTTLTMVAIPDLVAGVMALSLMACLHNVFVSLQDVSVDALAVDLLEEHERGRVNGLMYGSSYLGTFIGGAGLSKVVTLFDLRTAMIVQAAMLVAIMLLPMLLRERAGERLLPWTTGEGGASIKVRSTTSIRELFRALVRAFSLRSTFLGAVLAFGVKIGAGVLSAVAAVLFIQKLGWTRDELTNVEGGLAVWLGLAGSFGGGFLADRVGPKRLAGIATVLLGATWIGFAFAQPLWPNKLFITGFVLVQEVLLAVMSVSLFALFMGISWPLVAGTQFTAYMALLNLSNTVGAKLADPLSEWMSVNGIYILAGILQIAVILVLRFIDPRETRRMFNQDPAKSNAGGAA